LAVSTWQLAVCGGHKLAVFTEGVVVTGHRLLANWALSAKKNKAAKEIWCVIKNTDTLVMSPLQV